MVLTQTQPNSPNSAAPSITSPSTIRVKFRRSSEIKPPDTSKLLPRRKISEGARSSAHRSRNLSRASASEDMVQQRRSSSTCETPHLYRLERSQSRNNIYQEMIEVIPSHRQEDLVKTPPSSLVFLNSRTNRRISTSAMTITREGSMQDIKSNTPQDLSLDCPPEVDEFIDMISKPVLIQRKSHIFPEALPDEVNENNSSVFIASPPKNPDHLSQPPRLRTKIPNASTPERICSGNGSTYDPRLTFKGNSTVRHRLGQIFTRSTPDINMEFRQTNAKSRGHIRRRDRSGDNKKLDMVGIKENKRLSWCNPNAILRNKMQIQKLQNRLRCFEHGKLPKIPPELCDYFPQDLPAHDFTAIEKMWNKLTSSRSQDSDSASNSQSKKTKDLQLSAIVELLYTEACYIKTLEMIINVHIAVYLDLTKSSVSNSNYNPVYRGGSLNRLADPVVPTELARPGSSANSVSSGTYSSSLGGMFRRIRGRISHDNTNSTFPTISSSSSLSNISVLTLSEFPGFSGPPVEDIFGNIGSVYRANHTFWIDCFEPGIVNDEILDTKFCIRSMQKAFSKFKKYFEPYVHFLEAYNILVSNIRQLDENNKGFSIYHEWTKMNNTLNSRESLSGLLAQPFQRLTRYGILIKRIKESTTDEYEIAALTEMIETVDDFVKEVDVNQPEQLARTMLNDFIQRIHKYSFADTVRSDFGVEISSVSSDIGSILRQPMWVNGRTHTRKPIAEVQAKVRYMGGKVSEALCVLLSDMVLICKQSITKRHLSVNRPPIFLTYLTIQQKKDNPDCYVAMVRNDYGLLVDCYSFSSEEKDLEEWISKVLRQKAELMSAPRPVSVNRSSLCSPSYLYSTTANFPDRSIYGSSRHLENTPRFLNNDSYSGIAHSRYGSRRNSEAAWQLPPQASVDLNSAVIGRPQQLLDGPIGLIPICTRRKSIFPTNSDHGDSFSPVGGENVSVVERTKSEACLKSPVYKSASNASDSSNASTSTTSSVNTTSGDYFGSCPSEAPGAVSAVPKGIPLKITRNSLGRVPFRYSELINNDATVNKSQTN